jgi:Zn-dependent M28 family amino/carboxypeptidase
VRYLQRAPETHRRTRTSFFRSDHLEFAIGGVPSLETSTGIDHWKLRGVVEGLPVLLEIG